MAQSRVIVTRFVVHQWSQDNDLQSQRRNHQTQTQGYRNREQEAPRMMLGEINRSDDGIAQRSTAGSVGHANE
jgi:hypothetical protein